MDELFQYDYEQTNEFWEAAMNNDLTTMDSLALNPRVSFNLQRRHEKGKIQTPLDWAITNKNNVMVKWLCNRGAWSFKYKTRDFSVQYPNLKQHYNGKKSYRYRSAVKDNNLEAMIAIEYEIEGEKFSPNIISNESTALDCAVRNGNEKIAIHLISRGAKLCMYSLEEFAQVFPNLQSKEKSISKNEQESKFDVSYPELSLLMCDIPDKQLIVETFLAYIKQIEDEHRDKMITSVKEYDGIFMELSGVKKLNFLEKDVVTWSPPDVCEWIKSKCPDCLQMLPEMTGEELLELNISSMISMNLSKENVKILYKEIEKLKEVVIIQPSISYYATTNYQALISSTKLLRYQDEVFLQLRRLIQLYCVKEDISQQDGLNFFKELEKELLQETKQFDNITTMCLKLWTNCKTINGVKLSSILCESLVSDVYNSLKISLPLIKTLCYLSPVSKESIIWPKDNLLYGCGSVTKDSLSLFVSGKKYRYSSLLSAFEKKRAGGPFCERAEIVLYVFHLSNRRGCKCYNVTSVENRDEREFVFLPYSVFTVRSVTNQELYSTDNPHVIELDVAIDSEQESEFLPLIPPGRV